MPWQMADPLAAAAAAAGGVFKGQDDAKQRAIEAARQAQIDKQTAAYQAAQTAYEQSQMQHTAAEDARTAKTNASVDAFRKSLPAVPSNFKSTKDQINWLMKQSYAALQAGDKDTADTLRQQAGDLSLVDTREATAAYTAGAKTNETNAHTNVYNSQADYLKGWKQREQDKVRLGMAGIDQKTKAEAIRAGQLAQRLATSVQIAGIHEGGAQNRAQMLLDGRETMALMAQDFVINQKMPAEQASRVALAQFQGQLKNWQQTNAVGQANALANNTTYTPPPAPTFQPNITVNSASPQSQQPMQVIMMPITLPDGSHTAIPVHRPAATPRPAVTPHAHSKPGVPHAAKPKPAAAQENLLQQAGDAFHKFLWGH